MLFAFLSQTNMTGHYSTTLLSQTFERLTHTLSPLSPSARTGVGDSAELGGYVDRTRGLVIGGGVAGSCLDAEPP